MFIKNKLTIKTSNNQKNNRYQEYRDIYYTES
jgi:hypothetical protein